MKEESPQSRDVSSSSSSAGIPTGGHFVVAVIVTYHPVPSQLRKTIQATLPQVGRVIIVDNGSPGDLLIDIPTSDSVMIIPLPDNVGVAAAQNEGLSEARRSGATHVLLLDQDSVPDSGMLERLLHAQRSIEATGVRVAAVGPHWMHASIGLRQPFTRCRGISFEAVDPEPGKQWIECDSIISAGSLMPFAAIDAVGSMESDLFIDHVDTEWCLRARSLGYGIYGVHDAMMEQSTGENAKALWLFGWRRIVIHKPFRYYYMFRNSILLNSRSYVQQDWKRCNRTWLVNVLLIHGLFVGRRKENLLMMWRGIRDGRRGITGPMQVDIQP